MEHLPEVVQVRVSDRVVGVGDGLKNRAVGGSGDAGVGGSGEAGVGGGGGESGGGVVHTRLGISFTLHNGMVKVGGVSHLGHE